jgi:glycosyltransferase involved in cell wall biosynthesis
MPRVSIGLPVYNGERYLEKAIDSIRAQTFSDFELIISDNASIDRTQEICRDYQNKDGRISYYRFSENQGVARNFNRVFELSKCDYFKWATADDYSTPEQIEKCINVLDSEPDVVLCYPKTILIDENGKVIQEYNDNLDLRYFSPKERFFNFLDRVGLCNVQYGLIRAGSLRQTSLLRNYPGSDVVMLGELTLYGQFFEIPEFMFFRRFHPQASSSINCNEDRQAFYDPKTRGKLALNLWRDQFEYLLSILHAPLKTFEKVQMLYLLLRFSIGMRQDLIRELNDSFGKKWRKG